MIKYLKIAFFHDRWNIGMAQLSAAELIARKGLNMPVKWLDEPDAEYAADPFMVTIKGNTYLFYEELNMWKGLGELVVTQGADLKKRTRIVGLPRGRYHFSYPCIFQDRSGTYCIPECADKMNISLYKVNDDNPSQFALVNVLASGKRFVDSTICFYKNKYWLFSSVSGENDLIYIYHAETIDGQFMPHLQSPVSVTGGLARSGGSLFIVDDKLYRPVQNPKIRYGGSLYITEISDLTESTVSINNLFELKPQYPYSHGLHHLCISDGQLIVDGKRRCFSAMKPIKYAISAIRQRLMKLSALSLVNHSVSEYIERYTADIF